MLVAQGIPRAGLLPFGGLISDRLGAARVAPITATLRAVLLLGIAGAVIASPEAPIVLLAVAGALLGVIDAISYPASMALVPAVAPKDSLAKVNTGISGIESIGDLIGPVAAAGLYALIGPGASLTVVAALALLLGGVLGNLYDRVLRPPGVWRGEVIDWIELPNWPVFNLADSAIVCAGIAMTVLALFNISHIAKNDGKG